MKNINGTNIVTVIGMVAVAVTVYAYGEYKYYDGRVSKSKELMPILESLNDFITDLKKSKAKDLNKES